MKFIIFYDTYYTELTFDPEGFEIWEFQKIILEKLHIDPEKVICVLHDRGILGRDIPFEEPLYKLCYHPVVYILVNHFPKIEDIPFRDNYELFVDFLEDDQNKERICNSCYDARERGEDIGRPIQHLHEESSEEEVYEKDEKDRRPLFRTNKNRDDEKKKKKINLTRSNTTTESSDSSYYSSDIENDGNRKSEKIIKNLDSSYPNVESSGASLVSSRQREEAHQTQQAQAQAQSQRNNTQQNITTTATNLGNMSSLMSQLFGPAQSTSITTTANITLNEGDDLLQSIMGLMNALGGLNGPSLDSFLGMIDNLEDVPVTLDQESINKLPVFKFKDCRNKMDKLPEDQQSKCSICLDDFDDEDEVRMLFCKHVFHKNCVDKWLIENNVTCPLCRSDTRE